MSEVINTLNGTEGIEMLNLLVDGRPRSREEVVVDFSVKYNRKSSPDIDEVIETTWKEKCLSNPRLFNGSKFRFAGVENAGKVKLNVGITSYKELMATNCHSYGKGLVERGRKDHESENALFSDALGIGSLLLTADEKFLFIKRALWTGEDKGKIDRAGGHPEPEHVASSAENGYCDLDPLAVRNEIFDSVLHEIVDEINLPLESLNDPLLLGTLRSIERFGRPTAEFLVKCSLTSEEVEKYYALGTQAEADETVGIIFLSEIDVRKKQLKPEFWSNLTDAACGAVELYSCCAL